jgi:hypothetical protein
MVAGNILPIQVLLTVIEVIPDLAPMEIVGAIFSFAVNSESV